MPSSTVVTWALVVLLTCSELSQSQVFLQRSAAVQLLLLRRRRANSHLMEEVLPGNLERECYEESCSQEEALEIFQSREKTLEFWFVYQNLNPCRSNPCLNGGICSLDRGDFLCLCPPQYRGKICESDAVECSYRNGGCMQYCRDLEGGAGVQCGCADGYDLDVDGKGCSETVAFPCGRKQNQVWFRGRSLWSHDNITMETDVTTETNITTETDVGLLDGNGTDSWVPKHNGTETEVSVNASSGQADHEAELWEEEKAEHLRIVGGDLEKQGGSPWQVLIRRSDGYGFCGGTLVSDRWVVTAAHCLEENADHVTIGDYDKKRPDLGEQLIKVQKAIVHPHFHAFTFDSDVALLYLAQPVAFSAAAIPACLPDRHLAQYLLKDGNRGQVTGWGTTQYLGRSSRFLRKVVLPVIGHQECRMSTDQVITDNMFCAGYLEAPRDSCSGDSGGPFVVHYRDTWFLTGVVSWGEKCAAKGKYGVYTRLGNFLSWIQDTMQRTDLNGTES